MSMLKLSSLAVLSFFLSYPLSEAVAGADLRVVRDETWRGVRPVKPWVMIHTPRLPSKSEIDLANGMVDSVGRLCREKGIRFPEDKRILFEKEPGTCVAIVESLKTAAYYGHPDALRILSDVAALGLFGVPKNSEFADAIAWSKSKNLWEQSNRHLSRGEKISTAYLCHMPGAVADTLLKEARKKEVEEVAVRVPPKAASPLERSRSSSCASTDVEEDESGTEKPIFRVTDAEPLGTAVRMRRV